jgi:hypothetical protein
MSNLIKSLITGAVMSLSKLNQVKDKESFIDDTENDVSQEQQVRKQEIKLISEKRFYDILEKTDDIFKQRNAERTAAMLEARNITEDFLSFRNYTYSSPMHEQLSGNDNSIYKFKTDNDICKYASDVHIKENDGKLTLNFLINLYEHPIVTSNADGLTNLTAFAVNHNARVYAYDIIAFNGIIRPNPYEIFVVFEAKCVMNGEYARELSNEGKTTHKDDLIDPKTFKL